MESKNITAALIKVQQEMEAVEKNKINPFFKSKYADLQTIWDTAKKVLGKNGLAVTQVTGLENGIFGLATELLHTSGESIKGFYVLQPSKPNDPQALAAAVTYARRIALSAILSIVTDEDDDGNHATGHSEASRMPQEAARAVEKAFPKAETRADSRKTTFIPDWAKEKSGKSKAGKDYTAYEICNPDGIVFSTFDAGMFQTALKAEENKTPVIVTYVQNGKFYNAIGVEAAELESVPF